MDLSNLFQLMQYLPVVEELDAAIKAAPAGKNFVVDVPLRIHGIKKNIHLELQDAALGLSAPLQTLGASEPVFAPLQPVGADTTEAATAVPLVEGIIEGAILGMARPKGVHPEAFQHYMAAFRMAGLDPHRVIKTVDDTEGGISGPTHNSTQTIKNERGEEERITPDMDIHVRDLDEAHQKWLLFCLAEHNICGFVRNPNLPHESSFAVHLHAWFPGILCNESQQQQTADWCEGRNGLASHADEPFWRAPLHCPADVAHVKELLLATNPDAKQFF